ISKQHTLKIFNRLGIKTTELSEDEIEVTVPTFRVDIEREIDLIEEIARISGYDNIPTIPKISISLGLKHDETLFTDRIREYCNALGLYELINNPLQPKHFAALTGNAIEVSNPQSIDMKYLRTSLLSGVLNVVTRNLNRGEKNLALFEIGNIFNLKKGKKVVSGFNDFDEEEILIFVLTGNKIEREWYSDTESFNFYDLKGMVNSFIDKISLDNLLNDSYYTTDNSIYEYYLTKFFKDRVIGNGGKVKDHVLKQFDIDQDVYCFEFNLDALKEIPVVSKKYAELLRYPKVILDFAFIFDKETKFEDVSEFIKNKGSKLLKYVNVFDIFESKEIGDNKKSIAFQLEYYDSSRTLTENEVEKDFENLIKLVSKKFNAKLRGN
ncbi:MAG: phenylalanine--tRNA ligase subunit beta, partial [Bacteroidetes bacterium]|nr:phenylalanine--tRNA ligase subunit beta [Bacteroidota bacterium]